jgi:hypothetical protein
MFVLLGNLCGVSIQVCEDLEAFGKVFLAGDRWVEGDLPIALSGQFISIFSRPCQ